MAEKIYEAWQERVIEEHAELKTKIDALQVFMLNAQYKKLEEVDQYLMSAQLSTMQNYALILFQRITRF